MCCSAMPHSMKRSERPARKLDAAVRGQVGVEDDEVVALRPSSRAPRRRPRRRTLRSRRPVSPRAFRRPTRARPRGRLSDASSVDAARAQAGRGRARCSRSSMRAVSSATALRTARRGRTRVQAVRPPPSASATGCSMNETPLPLIVWAMSTFGGVAAGAKCAKASRNTAGRARRSASTSQPNARSFASRSPSATISSVGLSDWSSLWSTTTLISPRRSWAAGCSASQFWPSCSSPSPVITTTRPPRPSRRFAQRHAVSLGDAHAERAGVGLDPGHADVGMAVESAEPTQPEQPSRGIDAEREERCVEPGHVVALRREVDVAVGSSSRARRRQLVEQEVRRCRSR